GNGLVEPPETCDDGNIIDRDGCSAQCHTEICGDSVINNRGRESCDDGNTTAGDGCSDDCQLEAGVRRCQETIAKATRGYAYDRIHALRRCRDQLNRGNQLFVDDAGTQPLNDPNDCASEHDTAERIGKAA